MNDAGSSIFLFSGQLPHWLTVPMSLMAAVVWLALHYVVKSGSGLRRVLVGAGRIAAGFSFFWALTGAFSGAVVFASGWLVWIAALAGVGAVEVVTALYRYERAAVGGRIGAIIVALRILTVLTVTVILFQPVLAVKLVSSVDRHVAVLFDVSRSMTLKDGQLTEGERIRFADAFMDGGVRRKYMLNADVRKLFGELEGIRGQLEAVSDSAELFSRKRAKLLDKNMEATVESIEAVRKTLAGVAEDKDLPVSDEVRGRSREIAGKLESAGLKLAESVRNAASDMAKSETNTVASTGLKQRLEDFVSAVSSVMKGISDTGDAVDEAVYKTLGEEKRLELDRFCAGNRMELAGRALFGSGSYRSSLLGKIESLYKTEMYLFDDELYGTDAGGIRKAIEKSGEPADRPAGGTDIAGAIEKAVAAGDGREFAGVVIVSDFRHTGSQSVEPVAVKCGMAGTRLVAVAVGNEDVPPLDAGILEVHAPETIMLKDTVSFEADLTAGSLSGSNLTVKLFLGQEAVATQVVAVASARFSGRIKFSHRPEEKGLQDYRIVIDDAGNEEVKENNSMPVPVMVSDDMINLLVIEGEPRWEFRYLKNLFRTSDRNVRMQYMIYDPDSVADVPEKPLVYASVNRAFGESEATALPENEAEWMKFDVIVLGDVDPARLGDASMEVIRKFVKERGGTLITIAGRAHMPHRYGGTPVEEVVPVVFDPSEKPILEAPEKSYRIALTEEGRDSAVMSLSVDRGENARMWGDLPEIYWRHSIRYAKEGSRVLAYAMPEMPPDYLKASSEHEVPDEGTLKKRLEFQRSNPLAVVEDMGFGKVMFLGFDHTWRLRYRTGDSLHYQFWGQVMRWAASDKIMFGNDFVRLDTEKWRYEPGERIKLRARLLGPDYSMITDARPVVEIYRGDKRVARKKLRYEDGSHGVYHGDAGELAAGYYEARLSYRGNEESTVRAGFAVVESQPAEYRNLSGSREEALNIASQSGGMAGELAALDALVKMLGDPVVRKQTEIRYELWDSWLVYFLLLASAGCEWALRKKGRLP